MAPSSRDGHLASGVPHPWRVEGNPIWPGDHREAHVLLRHALDQYVLSTGGVVHVGLEEETVHYCVRPIPSSGPTSCLGAARPVFLRGGAAL